MARRQPIVGASPHAVPGEMEFLIITGLSGAGKTLATHTLEDLRR
jgi:adenylylsulfate kinase-like enzyme